MSTTIDHDVALRYSKDPKRGLSHILEIQMDGLNRGAMLQFLSQYPDEAEVLPFKTKSSPKQYTLHYSHALPTVRKVP
eukprot:SAG31_NODE_2898_length_4934_cov_2.220430_3_plen_78_part_00